MDDTTSDDASAIPHALLLAEIQKPFEDSSLRIGFWQRHKTTKLKKLTIGHHAQSSP
jgi:hypothetical protein